MQAYKTIIVGGGIVGLATAYKLLEKDPGCKVAVLEKEERLGCHQTGNNSGVIHSGIYYKPGSLKAQNCVAGAAELKHFCYENGIEVDKCGKVIVATDKEELPRLLELERRGNENGVKGLRLIGQEELRELEPHANGIQALHSPETSIVDYTQVLKVLKEMVEERGGAVYLGHKVIGIDEQHREITIVTEKEVFSASKLINCAGVYADCIAEKGLGEKLPFKIFPFRGEYYKLSEAAKSKVKGLIYPVPDPTFPFLGVHLTKMIGGDVEAGPNAVLAFSKEGYKKHQINLKDCWNFFTYPGFWHLTRKYWKMGIQEMVRSFSKKAFLTSLQRLVPDLEMEDIEPINAGIRAQLLLPNGFLHDDFCIEKTKRMVHVLNAPSPAATASFAIGTQIVDHLG